MGSATAARMVVERGEECAGGGAELPMEMAVSMVDTDTSESAMTSRHSQVGRALV